MIEPSGVRLRSLAIEGWRGINHSIALANQRQILELLKFDGLKLYHEDLPFAFPHWTRAANASGLSLEQQAQIDALRPPDGDVVDCVYRIGSPFRAPASDDRRRTVTYMITELGLTDGSFAEGRGEISPFTRDSNMIVTPSRWSRDRLVDWGFTEDKIALIPHGVDSDTFKPMTPEERTGVRRGLGIGDEDTLFLNVGLPSWNKGVDLLLLAFARLRASGRKVRLILKDQRDLYGRSVEALIDTLGRECPALLAADTLASLSLISTNIGSAELRSLFAAADCYVSPYRAEGFNLPVIEAIACGTPVIVTRGGATDDFCDDRVALRVKGQAGQRPDPATGATYCFIEPALPDLIAAMDSFAAPIGATALPHFDAGRLKVVDRFSWHNIARELALLTVGLEVQSAGGDAAAVAPHSSPTAS